MLELMFYAAAVITFVVVLLGMLGSDARPWRCPRCGAGSEERAGTFQPWYHNRGGGRLSCRVCGTEFREHPNGSLVEARD